MAGSTNGNGSNGSNGNEADGGTANLSLPINIEDLKRAADDKYAPQPYEVPGYGTVRVRPLKTGERAICDRESLVDGKYSSFEFAAFVVSCGMIQPRVTKLQAKELPGDFCDLVSDEILRLSNIYREAAQAAGVEEADDPLPFHLGNGIFSGSRTATGAVTKK